MRRRRVEAKAHSSVERELTVREDQVDVVKRGSGALGRLGYRPALDGLRGVAIALVLLAHFGGMLGGSLGVDVFFVLSGFLISSLLLEERAAASAVMLRSFYARRARRLLPALAVMLAMYAIAAGLTGHAVLVPVLAEGFYTANAVEAFANIGAVASSGLTHLWSLAEEEQFYLVWPIVLLVIAARRRPLALISALLMLMLFYRVGLVVDGASHQRLYMGPDTHLDGLLAGALLAFLYRRGFRVGEGLAQLGFSLLIIGVFARSIMVGGGPNGQGSFWDGYLLPPFELAAALVVGAAASSTALSDALSSRPLVWLGKRSYSLYLWHYPVLWLLGPELLDALPVSGAALTRSLLALAFSLAAASLSYRFVEQPFRRRREGGDRAAAPLPASV